MMHMWMVSLLFTIDGDWEITRFHGEQPSHQGLAREVKGDLLDSICRTMPREGNEDRAYPP